MDSSIEMNSPVPCQINPRKLKFISPGTKMSEDDDEMSGVSKRVSGKENSNSVAELAISPPYRKVRALRLFDTPATPKTILQKSSGKCLLNPGGNSLVSGINDDEMLFVKTMEKPRPVHLHHIIKQQTANVNPFTPDSLLAHNKKRCRIHISQNSQHNNGALQVIYRSPDNVENCNSIVDGCDAAEYITEMHQAPKRLALQDTNISRYQKEFLELAVIGVGQFGKVYQCLNRLDGCIYAIKKSIKPIARSFFEKRALNEVWAHAVLGKHDNVVRYYSAWAEDNHMLIQNEYCNGGSLQAVLQKSILSESELKILLLHVAEGLRYIHSNGLVHMDLKPGNIFFTKVPIPHQSSLPALTQECYETGMDGVYEELSDSDCLITYKIGDLGHVTSVKEPSVEEGDCHYLPKELLADDFRNLFKVDIFALGLTLYEAAGGGPLPKNGPEWHNLRDGKVPDISQLSREFNDLIKVMTHPNPEQRPSSTSIFNNPILNSLESKSKAQLNQELMIEKRKNEILLRKLREARKANKTEHLAKVRNSPQGFSEQRCLRSISRNKSVIHPSSITVKLDNVRDLNKNVMSLIMERE